MLPSNQVVPPQPAQEIFETIPTPERVSPTFCSTDSQRAVVINWSPALNATPLITMAFEAIGIAAADATATAIASVLNLVISFLRLVESGCLEQATQAKCKKHELCRRMP